MVSKPLSSLVATGARGDLIVSLTSYPLRFPTLGLTLQRLLCQSFHPDRIILWVSKEAAALLPEDVMALKYGPMEILTTQDIGPHTKIIPTLRLFPRSVIVTADDDVDYWPTWLEELVFAWSGSTREIVCHRAHEITVDAAGYPRPYGEWIYETPLPKDSIYLFPTGVSGVLYPPGCLSEKVFDINSLLKLCPRNDDLWLYWMGRIANSHVLNLGTVRRDGRSVVCWDGSQAVALYEENVFNGGNDRQISNLIQALGWPPGQRL
jgi:hypothetical protein